MSWQSGVSSGGGILPFPCSSAWWLVFIEFTERVVVGRWIFRVCPDKRVAASGLKWVVVVVVVEKKSNQEGNFEAFKVRWGTGIWGLIPPDSVCVCLRLATVCCRFCPPIGTIQFIPPGVLPEEKNRN
jgi:hypothetical protein